MPFGSLPKSGKSPTKKPYDSASLTKSSSEKVLIPFQSTTAPKNENISPKSILRRANSAYNKSVPKFVSKDDSRFNYNQSPLDYIFGPNSLKKKPSNEKEKPKEFEDIVSPSEKNKDKSQEIFSPSVPRKLSNSLAVSISPKSKDSTLGSGSNFSLTLKQQPAQSLDDSMDSSSKKYKVVMINKSLSCTNNFLENIHLLIKVLKKGAPLRKILKQG